jgi:hypothetical protein
LREFGDFQTPPELVSSVLRAVYRRNGHWARALEPTCGVGNFIIGLRSVSSPPSEIQGIELQATYAARTQITCDGQIKIHNSDIFRMNLSELSWRDAGPLLVVGNPPWVTNSELGGLKSSNLPQKSNFKGNSGFGAKTGDSNFDIAEYIWIKLIKELAWACPTIALLCKTAVARNVLAYSEAAGLPLSCPEIYLIDAKKWFDAAVDACLFKVEVGSTERSYAAAVYSDLDSDEPQSVLGIANGALVSNCEVYERFSFLDGESPVEWRQGLKHDASSVMELALDENGAFRNRMGEIASVEGEHIYPLLKSSDLNNSHNPSARFRTLVTQKELGEDTTLLREKSPKLWGYLSAHKEAFEARKSSIYTGRPPFSIFGIGAYSFSNYKVAVSGLYKTIRFRVVGPQQGKPVMLDDTCYFVPCESAEQAAMVSALLNTETCLSFINSLVFLDSKRPVTKKVLQRVDLSALLRYVDHDALLVAANENLVVLGGSPLGLEQLSEFAWPGVEDAQVQMFPEILA